MDAYIEKLVFVITEKSRKTIRFFGISTVAKMISVTTWRGYEMTYSEVLYIHEKAMSTMAERLKQM